VEACLRGIRGIARYADALKTLDASLQEGDWAQAAVAMDNAEALLQCPKCRDDETALGPWRVLAEVAVCKKRWDEWSHPCHKALRAALRGRLERPGEKTEVLISEVRFTQVDHSEHFGHGEHEGRSIDWLARQLHKGRISTGDESMVINAVFFHGEYRALNNRHAVALHRFAPLSAEKPSCFVRVWPLVPGLRLCDGSQPQVMDWFSRAFSTPSDGVHIHSHPRGRSASPVRATRVTDSVRVHVSNIDFQADEAELRRHLYQACRPEEVRSVEIARRKNGQSNGYGWAIIASSPAADALVGSGLPDLRGRQLRLKVDSTCAASTGTTALEEGGWVRCKACGSQCAPLADCHLVMGPRFEGFSRDARGWDASRKDAYYCVAEPGKLLDCSLDDHPDREKFPFKLKQVSCRRCRADLGNIQTAVEGMEGTFGPEAAHFKAAQVLLELADCQEMYLEICKWKALRLHLPKGELIRLSGLTMRGVTRMFETTPMSNKNREVRLVSASRPWTWRGDARGRLEAAPQTEEP